MTETEYVLVVVVVVVDVVVGGTGVDGSIGKSDRVGSVVLGDGRSSNGDGEDNRSIGGATSSCVVVGGRGGPMPESSTTWNLHVTHFLDTSRIRPTFSSTHSIL